MVPEPSGKAADCNSASAGSTPAGTSTYKGYGDVAESADASDLKSGGGNTVWVQVPSSPPLKNSKIARNSDFFVFVLFFRTNYRTFVHSLYFHALYFRKFFKNLIYHIILRSVI